jgi:hypothetical protein
MRIGCRIVLGITLVLTTIHARAGPATRPADPQAVVEVGRYRLQSNPWVNLHQRLLHEARFQTPAPPALSGEDLSKWRRAVENYRAFLGKRSPIFDDELIATSHWKRTGRRISTAGFHAKRRSGRS